MSSSYQCRVCERTLAFEAEIESCPGCLAKHPWKSDIELKKDVEWDTWEAEETYHVEQYRAYTDRLMGTLRFAKEIKYHIDKANEAQRKKYAVRGMTPT